ncbi:MAG: AAA family ATPase, partial [Candidatus Bipolaricaulaceae bacterium]
MRSIDRVLKALEEHGCRPRRSGQGWKAFCPAHEDRKTPSLSVKYEDNKVLLHCFGKNCTPERIVSALGLTLSDLFDGPPAKSPPATEKAAPAGLKLAPGEHCTVYDVRDVQGELVAKHVRIDGPKGKRFVWTDPNGNLGLGGVKVEDLPLYASERIPSYSRERPVVVVEGEKAGQALLHRGYQALATVTGAATIPNPSVFEPLRGFRVVLWPDNDQAGLIHMSQIARRLRGLGIEVLRVRVPEGKPAGWDAADAEPDEIEALIAGAEPWDVAPELIPGHVYSASAVLSWPRRRADALVPGLIPVGTTLLCGRPKSGKSLLSLQLALGVASGGFCLAKVKCGEPRPVLYLALEDGPERIRRRLEELSDVATPPDGLQFAFSWPRGPEAFGLLSTWCEKNRGGLIIVDPIALLRIPSTKNQDLYLSDYDFLGQFAALSAAYETSV